MKINNIFEIKDYDNNFKLKRLRVDIEFETTGDEYGKVDGDALYYLISALSKYENRDINDLDETTKSQILTRLNICKDKIEELKRGLNDYI